MDVRSKHRCRVFKKCTSRHIGLLFILYVFASRVLQYQQRDSSPGKPHPQVDVLHSVDTWLQMSHRNATVSRSLRVKGHGVGTWFHHTAVCVNHEDGATRHTFAEGYDEAVRKFGLHTQTEPFRPRLVNWTDLSVNTKINALNGTSVLAQCWRNAGPNPVHFWFAYGKLLQLLLYASPFRIDTVLLHQCGEPRSLGPLFELLANTSLSLGQRRGFFHPGTRFISVNKEQYENTFFCMDEVEVDYLMRSFNDARVVQGVKREVFAYLGLGSPGTSQTLVSSNALRNGCHTCMRKLKFGLYERPESDLNRRLITNKKAVLSLFKTISKEHTTVFHVSRNDDLQELIDKFNNFDIVVSSHGSHYVNFLFTRSNRTALIEVSGTQVFAENQEENFWKGLVPHHQVNWPHMSPELELQALIDASSWRDLAAHERHRIKNAFLIINITHLKYAVLNAVSYVCECSDVELIAGISEIRAERGD